MFGRLFGPKEESNPSPFPHIQALVGKAYRVDSRLAGDAYLGHDGRGESHRIRVLEGVGEEESRQLKNDFAACRALRHPGLAPLRDIGYVSDAFWMARPAIDGPNLGDVMDGRPVTVEQTRQWAHGMLDALEVLSRHGIVYDNWTLSSVLLLESGSVLADVGFREGSWFRDRIHGGDRTFPADLVWLSSPEGLQGSWSPGSDLYCLACVIYRLLAGHPPHGPVEDFMAYLMKIMTRRAPSLATVRDDLPPGLVQLVDRLLLDPRQRDPMSFAEMRGLLLGQTPAPTVSVDPTVEAILQRARAEGVEDGIGEFTLNAEMALRKLRLFQFAHPHGFLLALLAAAARLESRQVRVDLAGQELRLSLDCPPIEADEISGIFQAVTTRGRRDPMTHLGLGVAGAFGAGAQRVELLGQAGKVSLSEVGPLVWKGKGGPGLEIRIAFPKIVTGLVAHPSLDGPQALTHLRPHLRWFPVPLFWGSETVSAGDRGHGFFPLPGPKGPEAPGAAWGCLDESCHGLYLRVDGLSYRHGWDTAPPGVGMILDGPWKLDLSYQGVASDPRVPTWTALAMQVLPDRALQALLASPLQREGAGSTLALLSLASEPEPKNATCARILQEADDIPTDYSYPLFDGRYPKATDWDRLVGAACRHARQNGLRGKEKASRLLTHPVHLESCSGKPWEEVTALALDAYPDREDRYWSFLLHVWVGFEHVSPSLDDVPGMLRRLSSVPIPANWDFYVRGRLIELATRHRNRLETLCGEWKACMPASFRKARQWCGRPTLESAPSPVAPPITRALRQKREAALGDGLGLGL